MATNGLADNFHGRILTNSKDPHAFENIGGEHTIIYPDSAADVAAAVKLSIASFQDIILRSGRSVVASDAVNGEDAVVINMEGLDDIHIEGSRVTVGPGVTMENFADELYKKGLFLPFRDNLIKTVAAGVLSKEPGMLTRTVGLIRSYLREIHVVKTDGAQAVAVKDDDLFNALLAKEDPSIITSLVFDALPEEESKKFWMAFFYLPYQEDTFKKLTRSAFEGAGKLPAAVDLSVKITITVYGIPVVRVAVAGKEGTGDREAVLQHVEQIVSQSNLGEIGFDVPHVTYNGTDIVKAIAEGGDVGGFSHGQISTKHTRVVDAGHFSNFVDPYCKVIDFAHGTDQNGMVHFPRVSMKSQMSLTPDNDINVTAFFFSPPGRRVGDDPELPRIAAYKRILNRIIPEVFSPPVRISLHPEPTDAEADGFFTRSLAISAAFEFEERSREHPEKLALRRPVPRIPDFKGEIFMQNDKQYKQKAHVYATSSYIEEHPEWVTPYMVTYPEDVADIQAAIKYGLHHDKGIVARSGGHQYCALSSGGGETIVLSMDLFSSMHVVDNMATLQVGSRLTKIAETLKENHITIPHGECPFVAMGGHCQTGGYGHLLRSFGLALDYVYSFKVVLADGTYMTVHRPTEKKDQVNDKIFWSVMGGGPNSFGILTEITFECLRDSDHPLSRGHQSYSLFQKEPFRRILQEVQRWTIAIQNGNDSNLPDDIDMMSTAISTDFLRFNFLNMLRFGWLSGLLILEMVYGNKNGHSENPENVKKAHDMMKRIYTDVNEEQTWPNKRRVSISEDDLTPLSFMSDAFVRRQGTTPDGREFKYPYEKRLNGTEKALTDGFVNEFTDLVYDTIHDQKVRLVFQMGLGGAAYKNSKRRSLTSCSRRDVVFQVVYDVFYTEGNQQTAKDYQQRMKEILKRQFKGEGEDIRLIWGSYGDTDINREWKYYYDSEALYSQLQRVKADVDPDDVFHTRFTVQLPAKN